MKYQLQLKGLKWVYLLFLRKRSIFVHLITSEFCSHHTVSHTQPYTFWNNEGIWPGDIYGWTLAPPICGQPNQGDTAHLGGAVLLVSGCPEESVCKVFRDLRGVPGEVWKQSLWVLCRKKSPEGRAQGQYKFI